ncbi:hypothetical protein SAMN04488245_102417 [Alloyangia pacifica]|uniref:Uncharacterized protein n=1 Tax=Alloyangia pacifica TaxID=311180 RepID=A0A1I6PRS5_9RHOB|nr:hypothetical protein SAMN04488245_102417 [Alloyangia pacifica]SFS42788.1 hypothetical protein SAMN04488050_101718 [Alloyangia pacifica]
MSDDQSGSSEKRASSRLTFWGLWGTAIYIAILIAGIWLGTAKGWITWGVVKPNEIGDFFAGILGPLAIIWVVLGFLQQGSELRLQVAEMANSVVQQKEMVGVTRESLEHARQTVLAEQEAIRKKYKPNLRVRLLELGKSGPVRYHSDGTSNWRLRFQVHILNAGEKLSDLEVLVQPEPYKFIRSKVTLLDASRDEGLDLFFKEYGDEMPDRIEIRCTSADMTRYKLVYRVRLEEYLEASEEAILI